MDKTRSYEMNQVHQILSVVTTYNPVAADFPIEDNCSSSNMPDMSSIGLKISLVSHRHFFLTFRRDSYAYWTGSHIKQRASLSVAEHLSC